MDEIKSLDCLVCGETFKIPQFIDTDNYDGQIICTNCASLLHVKIVQSKLRQYKVVEKEFGKLKAEEIFRMLKEAEQKYEKEG